MTIGAGSLSELVIFRRWAETGRSDLNEPVGGWADVESAWAERRDVSDVERIGMGDQLSARVTRLVLRWTPLIDTLDTRDQVELDGRDWDIRGVKTAGNPRSRMVEITAVRRSDEAAP